MREIKFRAWDAIHGWMEYDLIISGKDGRVFRTQYGDEISGSYTEREMILMQYIGLKDKNGVEIYEGDILRSGNWVGAIPSIDDLIAMAFEENSYGDYSEAEVIGNIYENTELLKTLG